MSNAKPARFTIEKKNRKYFACKFESGCPFKLVIDSNSEQLPIGDPVEQMLVDQSKVSKYGKDLIFALEGSPVENKAQTVTVLDVPYNIRCVERCKALNGRWDAENRVWVFSDLISDQVEELDYIYGSELVPIEISVKEGYSERHAPIDFCGVVLARAYGRDSGAKVSEEISVLSGGFASGGSVKNWSTVVHDNTVCRFHIPRKVLDEICSDSDREYWNIKAL